MEISSGNHHLLCMTYYVHVFSPEDPLKVKMSKQNYTKLFHVRIVYVHGIIFFFKFKKTNQPPLNATMCLQDLLDQF